MQSVLITGANGGLGKALVEIFQKNNFEIIALDIKFNNLVKFKDKINFIKYDLSNKKKISKISKIINKNKIDLLINNAAICEPQSIDNIKIDNFMKTLNINFISHVFLTLNLLENIKKNNGTIVNISSIHANISKKNFLPYALSKSALTSFSKNLSLESSGKFSVINIEPGAVSTKMLNKDLSPRQIKSLAKIIPNKKIIDTKNLSQLIYSFTNPKIKQLLNGVNIQIDGGISNLLNDN